MRKLPVVTMLLAYEEEFTGYSVVAFLESKDRSCIYA
jgi:hypothetical protein